MSVRGWTGGVLALLVWTGAAAAQDTVRLGMGDAARLAAQRNAQVLEAATLVAQAYAGVALERAALLPQLTASFEQSGRTINTATFGLDFPTAPGQEPFLDPEGEVVGPVRVGDARARLRQTLLDVSAFARARSARAGLTAAEAGASAAAQRAGALAANAYVQALRASAELLARSADAALAEELVQIARQQLQAGVGVRLDVTRAEAQLASLHAQQVTARTAAEHARLALARALDLGPNVTVLLTDTTAVVEPLPSEQEAIARARAQRADLQALRDQVRATELQLSAVRAERLPTLSLVADEGFIGKRWDHLLNTYTWAVQVSVPVFQGFRMQARVQQAEAALRGLQVRARDLEEETAYQVRTALLDVAGAREQLAAVDERVRLAEQELAEARERYQAGVAGTADVVTASLRLSDARTAHAGALAAYAGARVALAAAQGTITEMR